MNAQLVNEIENYMNKYEFTLGATLGGNLLQFITNHDTKKYPQGINCIINPKNKSFELFYVIPSTSPISIQIKTPKCRPYDNKEHFNTILELFIEQINKLS